MALTENHVAGLQTRMGEVIKCERMSKEQFMKITGIANIGRKLSGKIAITRADISKLKQTLLINDDWMTYGEGPMYLPEKLERKADELKRMSGDKFSCFNLDGINIESRLKNMVDNIGSNQYPAVSFASEHMMAHEPSPVENGTTRAEERELSSLIEKNRQLIQIINAQNETIKSKDSEIRLLRKILADNGIEV
jgi:hypothetical protein